MEKKLILFIFKANSYQGGPSISHQRIINHLDSNKFTVLTYELPPGKYRLFDLKLLFKIRKEVQRIKPNIIHIIGLELIGFYSVLASFGLNTKTKIIMAVHGTSSESIYINNNFFYKLIMDFFERLSLRLVDYFYVNSKYTLSLKIFSQYRSNSKFLGVIYNIVDIHQNIDLFSSSKDLNIILVGRIEKEKGYDSIIDIINGSPRNTYFHLFGTGSFKQIIENSINNDKVLFHGFKENPFSYIKGKKIMLTLTKHETFGMAIAEASLLGIPVIAPRVGGIPEIINTKNGFLLDNPTSERVISIIKRINDDKKNSIFKSTKIYIKNLLKKFSHKVSINKITKIYLKIMD
jgi:glycosyltransferase involved in cell wall biosynthesis